MLVDSSMKPEQTYQDLKELAEKLGVFISEQNLRSTGLKVKSGLCKVKGKNILVMDKKLPLQDKNEVLASCLSKLPHEDVFMVPALREYLDSFHEKIPHL